MSATTELERETLAFVERRLTDQGYTLIREPAPTQIPAFLGSFRPDAIAVGRAPKLVVELISPSMDPVVTAAKVKQLQDRLADQDEWALEVVYVGGPRSLPAPASLLAIRARFEEVRGFARTEPRAGLILLITLLEAVARQLFPERAAKPLTPATTIEALTSMGHIELSDAETLRRAGRLRNLVVHGDLTVVVPSGLIEDVIRIVGNLLDNLEREASGSN